MLDNIALLIHTFNGYEFAWNGCLDGYSRYFNWNVHMYWGTDLKDHQKHDFGRFNMLYSGHGEWSDRLINLLNQIDSEYIIYMQEDFWPSKTPPELSEMMAFVHEFGLLRLQIAPINRFYSLEDHGPLYFFKNYYKSKYLLSHQPSIWNKAFLLECLRPGENPWENEYLGSLRLNKRNDLTRKIALFPYDWYDHTVENGRFLVEKLKS